MSIPPFFARVEAELEIQFIFIIIFWQSLSLMHSITIKVYKQSQISSGRYTCICSDAKNLNGLPKSCVSTWWPYLWPMNLTFELIRDFIKLNAFTKFWVSTSNGSPLRVLTDRHTHLQTGPISYPRPLMQEGTMNHGRKLIKNEVNLQKDKLVARLRR